MPVFVFLLLFIWVIPSVLRTWRMARYYQIEEYKTNRYLRWLIASRGRWFPRGKGMIMLAGIVVSAGLQVVDIRMALLHLALWLSVAALLSLPEPIKETKKNFVRTPRAMRMVAVAFAVDVLFVVWLGWMAAQRAEAGLSAELSSAAILGYLGFLLSPMALPVASGLLYPVEASIRRRFWQQAHNRLKNSGAVTIGITGSYGKTSTKTFLAHVLAGKFKVFATPKSYNTEMGISRTINEDFDPTFGYQYFIAEMGAYVSGEIKRICDLTHPQISLLTAIGPMHLERFGTLENVMIAKYEIVAGLPADGVAFFNADDPYLRQMAAKEYPTTRVLVSQQGDEDHGARYVAENIAQSPDGLAFDVIDRQTNETVHFTTTLMGRHNISNILLVAATAHHLGMTLTEISGRVASLQPAEHRLRQTVHPNGVRVIDDAYSANPVGAASALEALRLYESGRRVVITPGMVELGTMQDDENFKLGQHLGAAASDIILVGIRQTESVQRGVRSTDFDPERLLVVDTFDEARLWFQNEVRAGDTVLFLNDLPDTYL